MTQMTQKTEENVEMIDFQVEIPNLDGDGISEYVAAKVPAKRGADGEWRLTGAALDIIEQVQSRYMGLMTPQEIKELRMRFQLTQLQMSQLIQAGEKSYTRWENGRVRLSRLVNIILCAIRDGFLPITYLQTLYEEGCDWYKKAKAYEALAKRPVLYKMCSTPAEIDTIQPVVSTFHSVDMTGRDSWLPCSSSVRFQA